MHGKQRGSVPKVVLSKSMKKILVGEKNINDMTRFNYRELTYDIS